MAAVKERTERDVVLSNLKEMISERIHNYIPEEYKYADIKFMDIMKNNGEELPALVINPEGINVSPTIYLDPFIDAYSANIPDEEILGKIGQLFAENIGQGESFADRVIRSLDEGDKGFDLIKDSVIMRVINTEMNSGALKDMPHRNVEDLSLIYSVLLRRDYDDALGTVKINNQMMETWGVTEDELYKTAVENTPRLLPTSIRPMQEVLGDLIATGVSEGGESPLIDMYIITNEEKTNGAAVPFCDKASIDGLCDRLGKGLILLPSSIHELIALPDNNAEGIGDLAELIQHVNETQVASMEVLGSEPYHYDKETGFMLAERFEKLQEERQLEKVANKAAEINSIGKQAAETKPAEEIKPDDEEVVSQAVFSYTPGLA